MDTKTATAFLSTVTIAALRTMETRNGVAWTGNLRRKGRVVVVASNEGNGGCTRYYPAPGIDRATADAFLDDVAAACIALGMDRFEPVDGMCCCLVPGNNGADAVRDFLAAMAS